MQQRFIGTLTVVVVCAASLDLLLATVAQKKNSSVPPRDLLELSVSLCGKCQCRHVPAAVVPEAGTR